jgi:hypothetical protein
MAKGINDLSAITSQPGSAALGQVAGGLEMLRTTDYVRIVQKVEWLDG